MVLDLAFHHLRTFREVAQQGNVSKAARNLGYAQSSVTSHIKALETKLGYPLFRRLPHGVRLTPHGEIVKEYTERIFQTVNELSGALHPGAEAEGRVPLGADALLMEQRVGHLIRETRYRYPKVQVSPRATSLLNVAEAVLRGELPLALVALDEGAPALPAELTAEKLPPLPLVPVGSPSLAAADDLAHALRSVRVLTINAECTCHRPLLAALRDRYGIDAPVIEAGSVGGVRELARSGYGVAMLPPEPSLAAQHLAVIPTLPSCELDVRVLYAQPEHLSQAARSVLELLRRLPLPAAGTDRMAAVTSLTVLNQQTDSRPLHQIAS